MERLELYLNNLSGPIPAEIFREHTKLRRFLAGGNFLTGTIPTDIGLLTQATHLDLSDNSLEGSVPTQFGALSNLGYLNLSGCSGLFGVLPFEISQVTSLTTIYLHGTSVSENPAVGLCSNPSFVERIVAFSMDCLEDNIVCNCCTSCCNSGGCQEMITN